MHRGVEISSLSFYYYGCHQHLHGMSEAVLIILYVFLFFFSGRNVYHLCLSFDINEQEFENLATCEADGSEGKVSVHVLPKSGHWVHVDNP